MDAYDKKQYDRLTLDKQHSLYPEPGDYWAERLFNGVLVVLRVTNTEIIICKERKDVGRDYWTWNLNRVRTVSREYFTNYVRYNVVSERCWCSVQPKAHMWAVENFEETMKEIENDFIGCPV
jgi:hypothetical protein